MQEHSAKRRDRFTKNLNSLLLATLAGLLIFLLVQIVLRNDLYALPLLALAALQFALSADGLVWDLLCCILLHATFLCRSLSYPGGTACSLPGRPCFVWWQ